MARLENFDPLFTRWPYAFISAGFPRATQGHEEERLNFHDLLVPRPSSTFFYRVKGDVLRDEHIRDGSIIVVDRSLTPSWRHPLVLVEQDGQFAIVKYSTKPDGICGVVTAVVTRV